MEKYIEINGCEICYNEEGNTKGFPIILMHGWGCNNTTLKSVERILLPNMHVYNIDLPGHGKSHEPPAIWGIEEYTSLIERFCEKLDISNPVLFGHSFGGRIAILFSSRNQVRKVILTDAAGIKPHRNLMYYIKVYTYKTIKHLLPFLFGKKRGEVMLEKYRKSKGSADYGAASKRMRAVMSKCVNQDWKHVMPDIKAPTILIWGTEDKATPLSDAKTMNKLIPDSGLVEMRGCGHYSFLDNPILFREVIKSF